MLFFVSSMSEQEIEAFSEKHSAAPLRQLSREDQERMEACEQQMTALSQLPVDIPDSTVWAYGLWEASCSQLVNRIAYLEAAAELYKQEMVWFLRGINDFLFQNSPDKFLIHLAQWDEYPIVLTCDNPNSILMMDIAKSLGFNDTAQMLTTIHSTDAPAAEQAPLVESTVTKVPPLGTTDSTITPAVPEFTEVSMPQFMKALANDPVFQQFKQVLTQSSSISIQEFLNLAKQCENENLLFEVDEYGWGSSEKINPNSIEMKSWKCETQPLWKVKIELKGDYPATFESSATNQELETMKDQVQQLSSELAENPALLDKYVDALAEASDKFTQPQLLLTQ